MASPDKDNGIWRGRLPCAGRSAVGLTARPERLGPWLARGNQTEL